MLFGLVEEVSSEMEQEKKNNNKKINIKALECKECNQVLELAYCTGTYSLSLGRCNSPPSMIQPGNLQVKASFEGREVL